MKLFKSTVDKSPQKTPGLVQLASGPGSTLIILVVVCEQPLSEAVYEMLIGPLKPAGLNEVPVTPSPLHVPVNWLLPKGPN